MSTRDLRGCWLGGGCPLALERVLALMMWSKSSALDGGELRFVTGQRNGIAAFHVEGLWANGTASAAVASVGSRRSACGS